MYRYVFLWRWPCVFYRKRPEEKHNNSPIIRSGSFTWSAVIWFLLRFLLLLFVSPEMSWIKLEKKCVAFSQIEGPQWGNDDISRIHFEIYVGTKYCNVLNIFKMLILIFSMFQKQSYKDFHDKIFHKLNLEILTIKLKFNKYFFSIFFLILVNIWFYSQNIKTLFFILFLSWH